MSFNNLITHDFRNCPRCGAQTKPATAWSGTDSEFFMACPACNTYIDTYVPMDHQAAVHRDNYRFTGNFGGYGTGKTYTTRKEIQKHIFLTPGGLIVVGAKVTSQYEMTIKREFENDFPAAFVKSWSEMKKTMTFINGCQIIYRPYEDPDTLRSYNATMFVILEASEVKFEAFSQLTTRLRSDKGGIVEKDKQGNPRFEVIEDPRTKRKRKVPIWQADWRKGLIESNPDPGWIRQNFVLESTAINYHGNVMDQTLTQQQSTLHPGKSSHITATDSNLYLPADFYENVSVGKPLWWINKFLHGSFAYSEGLVYPKAPSIFIEPFEIPQAWPRMIAFDYGIVDPSVFIYGALDLKNGKVYIYKEARRTEANVAILSQLYFEESGDIPDGGLWHPPIIDPKSGPKRNTELKTLIDEFLDYGVFFVPGAINVDARIFRLNTYIEEDMLYVFNTCKELKWEFDNYKFPDRTLDNTFKSNPDKPRDANNHGINAVEWIVMELPGDPRLLTQLGTYSSRGRLDLPNDPRARYNMYDPLSDATDYAPKDAYAYEGEDPSQYF